MSSSDSTPFNPYVSPSADGPVLAESAEPPAKPLWLTIACVIAVVFGALGLLASISALVMISFGQAMGGGGGGGPPPSIAGNPELKAHWEMQVAIELAERPYYWVKVAQMIAQVGIGGALLYGGVLSLGMSQHGRHALIWAYRVAAIYLII